MHISRSLLADHFGFTSSAKDISQPFLFEIGGELLPVKSVRCLAGIHQESVAFDQGWVLGDRPQQKSFGCFGRLERCDCPQSKALAKRLRQTHTS
jgi:hypothetical protein